MLFFVTFSYFFQGGGWNQNSRICLTRAILHDRTFIIDNYKEDSQDPYFEFVNTGDWSYYNGHYYTVRPPGLSFMAVVPFGIAEYFFKHYFPADTERQVLLSSYASTLCTSSLCATLLCLMLFHFFNRFFNIARTGSLFLTIFFGLKIFWREMCQLTLYLFPTLTIIPTWISFQISKHGRGISTRSTLVS